MSGKQSELGDGGRLRPWIRRAARAATGLVLLAAALLLGDILVRLTGIPLPRAIVGLALVAIPAGLWPAVRAFVAPGAGVMLLLLGALIVRPLVLIMGQRDLIFANLPAIAAIIALTTLLAGVTTAWTYRKLSGHG